MGTEQDHHTNGEYQDIAPDLETCSAVAAINESQIAGGHKDRSSALSIWQRIASGGKIYSDELWFIEQVAQKIVAIEADGLPPSDRIKALAGATGLLGTRDKHREARRFAEMLEDFWDHDAQNQEKTQLSMLRDHIKTHPELWPEWDRKPDDADFTEIARSVLKSRNRKK